jgi:PleD family two-component response regulator
VIRGRLVAKTILIVDDYAPSRESARKLLEAEGIEVVGEAENGVAALRVALRKLDPPPEVILTSSRDDYRTLVSSSAARAFVRKDELSGESFASALAGPCDQRVQTR